MLSTGNQSLDGAGSLAAEQPVGVLPLGELNHRSLEATGQQLGLQLLNQALRGGLPCAVAIEGDQEVFHEMRTLREASEKTCPVGRCRFTRKAHDDRGRKV